MIGNTRDVQAWKTSSFLFIFFLGLFPINSQAQAIILSDLFWPYPAAVIRSTWLFTCERKVL